MIFIENVSDLFLLVDNDESSHFLVDPNNLINDIFLCEHIKSDKQIYKFFYKNDLQEKKFIELTIDNNLIIEKNFYLIENGKNICYRSNDRPTNLIYNCNGTLSNESWRKGLIYFRINHLAPTSISYKENVIIFIYSNYDKKKISISNIIYHKKTKKIISFSIKIFNKKIYLSDLKKEFPHIVEITKEDCYDLSKRILTKEILDLKELEYY